MKIKLLVRQISRDEFDNYGLNYPKVYFCNGCWFDGFDNVCAFPLYVSDVDTPFAYYEVIQDA